MAKDYRLPAQVIELAKGTGSTLDGKTTVPESVVLDMRKFHAANPDPTDLVQWRGWGGSAGRSWSRRLAKVGKRTLYVSRNLRNADDFIEHFKAQGFDTVLAPEDLHVTIAFSKTKVDWDTVTDSFDEIRIPAQEDRTIKPLGDGGAVVLRFESKELTERWEQFKGMGASWDYDGYQPHVTITWKAPADLDLSKVQPYTGELVFGPEVFNEIKEDWKDTIVEKVDTRNAKLIKVDDSLGLVFGWAVVCKVNGEPYFDLQDHHITEAAIVKAASEFMLSDRKAGDMHTEDANEDIIVKGTVVFAFPLTTDIAKSLDIQTATTGLLIAMKPSDPAILTKFRNGEYTGFSIGGHKVRDKIEVVNDG